MQVFTCILLGFLLVCAISVSLSKNLLNSILIYMSYSLVMSIIWIVLESPDLAITEAAVGAGVTSILFFVTLKKIHAIMDEKGDLDGTYDASDEEDSSEGSETAGELNTPEKTDTSKKTEILNETEQKQPESGNDSGKRQEFSSKRQKNRECTRAGMSNSDRSWKSGSRAAKGGKADEQETT